MIAEHECTTVVTCEENELEFLRFYDQTSYSMGPADSDIYDMIKEAFVKDTGKTLPPSYRPEEYEEDEE